ncbi:hypothetical protein ACU4GA_29870 [Methylobacterium oryzae CBMB20]
MQQKKPFILFGQGVILGKAKKNLRLLSTKQVFLLHGQSGRRRYSNFTPLNVGMLGIRQLRTKRVVNENVMLIAIGMRFDDRVTGTPECIIPKQAKVVHLDIDPAEIDKMLKLKLVFGATVRETLLTNLVNENKHEDWLAKFRLFQPGRNRSGYCSGFIQLVMK